MARAHAHGRANARAHAHAHAHAHARANARAHAHAHARARARAYARASVYAAVVVMAMGCAPEVAPVAAPSSTPATALSLPPANPMPAPKPQTASGVVVTKSGLEYEDLKPGTGYEVGPGQTAVVHYVGTLEDGTKFDSSRDRGQPFTFRVGAGHVIRGWDEGLVGMREGQVRRLRIPPELAYGRKGSPPKIPGDATLVFEVELIEVR